MMFQRSSPEADRLEAALAARLATALHARASELPHDVAERLRAGREQALARRRGLPGIQPASPRLPLAVPALAGVLQAPRGRGGNGWWPRLGPLLPLAVLLAGLQWVSNLTLQQQVSATAEIDAVLLADELPPAAYADPGFAEYLRSADP